MSTSRPKVSLITINYNSWADTLEFLHSAASLTYTPLEIILVDNGSKQKADQATLSSFSNVTYVWSEDNLGFAGGNNLGMRYATGDFFFFLNNDTLLPPGFLEPIITFMSSHPDAGMASPKVLYPDGKTIQYAGAVAINPLTGRGKRLGLFEKDQGQYDDIRKTDLGHGAALILPRSVAEQIGPMPEVYFLYYEEHDWCEKVKRRGYNMYYIGNTYIIHKESVSTGGDNSPLKVFYLTRNRLLFMRRNFSGLPYLVGLIFFFVISIPKQTLTFALKRKWNLMASFYKGIFWNFTHSPG